MAKLMEKSINANGIKNIKVVNKNLNDCFDDFNSGFFDYIITNPPYIKRGGGIVNEKEGFSISRHEIMLTLDDIMKFSSQKLKSGKNDSVRSLGIVSSTSPAVVATVLGLVPLRLLVRCGVRDVALRADHGGGPEPRPGPCGPAWSRRRKTSS